MDVRFRLQRRQYVRAYLKPQPASIYRDLLGEGSRGGLPQEPSRRTRHENSHATRRGYCQASALLDLSRRAVAIMKLGQPGYRFLRHGKVMGVLFHPNTFITYGF